MRKYLYLAAVVGSTLCATLVAATAAYADTSAVLTVGAVGGQQAEFGDIVVASLAGGKSATFYSTTTGATGVSCSSSTFSSAVTGNPSAPGVATETLDDQTFASCTTNVFGTLGVRSMALNNLPYSVSVDGGTNAVTISAASAGVIQSTVVVSTILGTVTCVYRPVTGTINGVADNASNAIIFTNQQFNKVSGSALCLSTAYFSATYSPVIDRTQGGAVFVNAS